MTQEASTTPSPRFSLVFPTYNPGALLPSTFAEAGKFLAARPDWEIVFVCDGCSDGSDRWLADRMSPGEPRLRLVQYAANKGKGHAVRVGLLAARGQWRVFTDVDLAYRLDMVLRLSKALGPSADVAIAARHHPESKVLVDGKQAPAQRLRELQSRVFSLVVRSVLGIVQRDTQAGLKGLSDTACRDILPRLTCNGFAFDCELLVAANRLGYKVAEVPVTVIYDHSNSTVRRLSFVGMLKQLWAIRRRWRAGQPLPAPLPQEA